MKYYPKVSIVIPVYNGSNYLKRAIDSALAQTHKNIEIIVVNDGSDDNGATEEIAKSYGNKIKYIYKKNGGVATALNVAIENMSGEYFSWLSHDDEYFPEKVQTQIEFLSKINRKNVILYCNVQYIDKNSEPIYNTSFEKKHSERELNNGLFCMLNGYANGCSLLIPKKCFDEVGNFDITTKTGNDYEMWSRMFKKFDVKFVPNVLIKYRLHEEQDTITSSVYQQESDTIWKKIILSLNDKDISCFTDDIFNFYYDLANRMKEAKLVSAYNCIYKKSKKYYINHIAKVSIIMPCYNTERYLAKAIESILNQTFHNFQLIIVDDGSTDSSVDIIKNKIKTDFRVIYIKNKNEKGIAGAMNTGLDLANGQYITRMDSDDISLPTRIEKQVNFLDQNHMYGVCSVNISKIDESDNITLNSLFNKNDVPLEWSFIWCNPIANAPTMYRKIIIKNNNAIFSTKLKTAEDYDFLCKLVLKTRVYQIEEPLYQYRIHELSIFQNNYEETILNSIIINKNLVKKITNTPIPDFHSLLTVFKFEEEVKKINLIDCAEWMKVLLNDSKKLWKWNDEEFNSVQEDANNLIYEYILKLYEKTIIPIEIVKEEKTNIISKTLFSIKHHGIFFTIKHSFKKIIEKFMKK